MSSILVVGQTPPPFGGQAVMVEQMLQGDYGSIRLHHVRMAFSKEMDEIGKIGLAKLIELVRVILSILFYRVCHGSKVLYYPPGGSTRAPLIRDTIILLTTRWMFRTTIFHFHASGWADRIASLPIPLRWLARRAYAHPEIGIRLSSLAPDDGGRLRVLQEFIVPNGVEDPLRGACNAPPRAEPPVILFVGVLSESKGVKILIEACGDLLGRHHDFRLRLMGRFESAEFEDATREQVRRLGLTSTVEFLGVRTGQAKLEGFSTASIFCLPTYFESETFSVVLVEALSFGLPCVATRWRAIPDIVEDGVCGYLVPTRDAVGLGRRLETLIRQPELRVEMGQAARRRFLENFTLDQYRRKLQRVFDFATET